LYAAQLRLQLQQVDLQQLLGSLPVTRFDGGLDLVPLAGVGEAGEGWQAQMDLGNDLAGRLDDERLPLQRVTGTLRATPQRWQSEALELAIDGGSLLVGGHFGPTTQALDVRGELRRLPLAAIHGELASGMASALSGSLAVSGEL